MKGTIYITQKNQIRDLSKAQYQVLREMCHTSKNLFNVALYNLRQNFFIGKTLSYQSNCLICKANENYKLLQAGVSQQTLKSASEAFNSFLALQQKAKAGQYSHSRVRLPQYLPKDGYYPLFLSTNAINIKNGKLKLPLANEFKRQHPELKPILIPFPHRLRKEFVREVRINPKHNAQFFEIEFVCEIEIQAAQYLPEKALSIDLGLENLAACIDTTGASFIIDGQPLKTINQWFNKENARLQWIKDKQQIAQLTQRQFHLLNYRNNYVRDYLNKAARHIINYCVVEGIGKLIVGCNKEWKQGINIGKQNNQNFTQIPHSQLRNKLQAMCQRYGIEYLEQEESYTSQASFLDGDAVPIYEPGNSQSYCFSGKRVKRGLYCTKAGYLINSDLNGAANILRKSNHRLDFERVASGLLANPLRIRVSMPRGPDFSRITRALAV